MSAPPWDIDETITDTRLLLNGISFMDSYTTNNIHLTAAQYNRPWPPFDQSFWGEAPLADGPERRPPAGIGLPPYSTALARRRDFGLQSCGK